VTAHEPREGCECCEFAARQLPAGGDALAWRIPRNRRSVMHRPNHLGAALRIGLLAAAACAPQAARAEQSVANPCTAPAYRAFDFWLGDWEVFNAKGEKVGTSRIESINGGCALLENWQGQGGASGKSLNHYDRHDGQWHQYWVDSDGTRLRLAGGVRQGRMVLQGREPQDTGRGKAVQHRISWQPLEGGKVLQRWERSADGRRWTLLFEGTYVKG
jgi:hypothetical protein